MHIAQFARASVALGLTSASLVACASLSNKEKGAVIGATAGATVGAGVGRANGSTAKGAIIGAAVGGAVGAVIGHQMDQQAKEIEQNIPGATVERVGEGIQVTFPSGVLFDFDSDRVRPDAAQNLNTLVASLDKYPNSDLLIVGHTDSVGTAQYNQTLSEKRAQAAAMYLATHGVKAGRLKTMGRGEIEPIAPNSDEAGRAKNRRVEVAIYASEAYRSSLSK